MYIKSLVQDLEFRKPSRYVISFIVWSKDVLGNQDIKMNTGVSPLEYLAMVLRLGMSPQLNNSQLSFLYVHIPNDPSSQHKNITLRKHLRYVQANNLLSGNGHCFLPSTGLMPSRAGVGRLRHGGKSLGLVDFRDLWWVMFLWLLHIRGSARFPSTGETSNILFIMFILHMYT